ncbi:uncharacterized protein BXZ73DRAFT_107745 [Epithele typhae]|uniref:uncharacterized protein n=1 Tax=Epithele typhae TaxID=378194 RepID=UPI002008DEB7|nr:uncharacterized protein BXZ73DRAFT_107745 [Epithele typhae]KAH9911915.1 hypothetical protein BXZ73DRAFT_107745 [Epithele typhae]
MTSPISPISPASPTSPVSPRLTCIAHLAHLIAPPTSFPHCPPLHLTLSRPRIRISVARLAHLVRVILAAPSSRRHPASRSPLAPPASPPSSSVARSASSSPSRCSATPAPSSGGSASPAATLVLRDKAARCRLERYYREAYYDREHPHALQGLRAHRREHRDHDSPRLCEPERKREHEHEHAAQRDRADARAKPQHAIAPDGAGDGVERIYTPGTLCTFAVGLAVRCAP